VRRGPRLDLSMKCSLSYVDSDTVLLTRLHLWSYVATQLPVLRISEQGVFTYGRIFAYPENDPCTGPEPIAT
jgi:hypothetical protein